MKKIGIIGAMQVEIDLLIARMETYENSTVAGFPFYTGTLFGKDIVLTRCGVGKVNSAACTQILIDRFNVDCIINTGIAGSLRKEIGILDLVISSDVTHHDVRKAQMKNLFPYQESFIANNRMIVLAQKACETLEVKPNYHFGRIVSGECFVSDTRLKETIINEYSPACVEMEGSAIGHVAFLNNIPFLILRCISDQADDEAAMSYENFEKLAANQSAAVVLEMIKMM
ncbi:5'-methylthioadenosine/adenosylhomocysteine nucleosidase [Bacillus luteolus]|uniref:adenosylhomocysteine nucleosidase n=2 Tax=Litchfieldia luteola TaxID=682179 RepID=A0ABR9QGF4_9BACI|nr:5'-methylthioadenosine/adenosylhomocysteine nucleosidase [Cytobacillus luteolus]MBE4907564.1 5'-methylthioadenosine/adenosylhomocysteine nucleosidase [Cytobacillus luteolus]MBP1944337.1 adenosylhomocysteine nucleosidase [Cytobacillus luteolus]